MIVVRHQQNRVLAIALTHLELEILRRDGFIEKELDDVALPRRLFIFGGATDAANYVLLRRTGIRVRSVRVEGQARRPL